ncbi:MAG: hypothetical protein JWO03_3751 [Bacteroidetes bacterium]|nr:hypothetical protein [Bacteroidota bacterium]
MNFELVNDDYYPTLAQRLRVAVPEYMSTFDDEDGIYHIIFEFGQFLINHIDDDVLLSKSVAFINEAIEHGGHETADVISMEIFELLADDLQIAEKVKPKLSEKALRLF